MRMLEREKDLITGEKELELLHSIRSYPVLMGCTNQEEEKDLRAEQTWEISKKSGIIQLKYLVPLNILYGNHHNSGAIGKTWMDHHQEFAKFILKHNPQNVLEIGGAHGILSKECNEIKNIRWTIIEPNPNPIKGCKAKFIKGFFDRSFISEENFDTIIHSHLIEHLYDPLDFFKSLSEKSNIGQKLIFSLPNLNEMLKRKYTNCLNFEHTYFITEPLINFLLSKYGFKIIEKKYFREDHSIFFACKRIADIKHLSLPSSYYNDNKALFNEYINHHENLVSELNYSIKNSRNKVYLFGGHIFSQFLLEMGLENKHIECILDNDPFKQGSRLYGSKLVVKSPKILKSVNSPTVILKAGTYNDEIKSQILNNINPNTSFI